MFFGDAPRCLQASDHLAFGQNFFVGERAQQDGDISGARRAAHGLHASGVVTADGREFGGDTAAEIRAFAGRSSAKR